jgi:hypothetical protein
MFQYFICLFFLDLAKCLNGTRHIDEPFLFRPAGRRLLCMLLLRLFETEIVKVAPIGFLFRQSATIVDDAALFWVVVM